MIVMPPKVLDAKKRMARYYIQRLRDVSALYEQSGHHIRDALNQYDAESTQIEQMLSWLEKHSTDDEYIAALFSEMLLTGRLIFQERLVTENRLALYQHALTYAEMQDDTESSLKFLYSIAFCLSYLNENNKAIHLFEQIHSLAQAHGYEEKSASSMLQLGYHHSNLGRQNQAINWFLQALQLFHRLRDLNGEVKCLINLGYAAMDTGDWTKAEAYLSQAHEMAMNSDDYELMSQALTGISIFKQRQGLVAQAIPYMVQSKDVAKMTGSLIDMMFVAMNLAVIYSMTEQFSQAFQHYHEALEISRKFGRAGKETEILGNMGYTYYLVGDYENAREHTENALSLLLNGQSNHHACITMANLAAIHTKLEALPEARQVVHDGMQLAVDLENPQLRVMMIVAAVQYLVALAQSQSEQQQDTITTSAMWAGFVYAAPQAEEENRTELDKLRPAMVEMLGEAQVEQLMKRGQSLTLESITDYILRWS